MSSETHEIAWRIERAGYRRSRSSDRSGLAAVALAAAGAAAILLWHRALPSIPTVRPATTLHVLDLTPTPKPAPSADPQPSVTTPAATPPSIASATPEPAPLVSVPGPAAERSQPTPPSNVPPAAVASPAPPAPAAKASAAPAPAVSERSARADWQSEILGRLKPLLRYPRIAERDEQQGVALVALTVERSGTVRSARIARGSGYPLLDGEAIATLKRGSPLPPPTADIPGDPIAVELPIQFTLPRG